MQITTDYVEKGFELAKETEYDFAKWLVNRPEEWLTEITEGKFSAYDILAVGFHTGVETTFEIKTASKSKKFKSYFVEYYQSGKPSGMQTTLADYQVYYDEQGDVMFIRTAQLDEYIKRKKLKLKANGYTSHGVAAAHGYVVPKSVFKFLKKHDLDIVNPNDKK